MRELILFSCCCLPCSLAVMHFIKIHKTTEFFKKIKLVFDQISFILSGSTPDVLSLFYALSGRNVFPALCAMICEKLKTGFSFTESWACALELVGVDLLSMTEKEEVLSFADSFGLGSVDEQIRICNRFSKFCDNAINEKKDNLAKNGKLYLSGSLLFGAILFIMLL